MSSHPLVVAARAPEEPHPASVQPVSSGTPLELELELREKLTENLRVRTRNRSAKLRYAIKPYANDIVIGRGQKLVGWPTRTLFTSIGNIPGGTRKVQELLALVNGGKIRFERATPEDIANAKRDPKTVHPNYEPPEAITAQPQYAGSHDLAPSFCTLHPEDLSPVDDDSMTSTPPSDTAARVRSVPSRRGQRIDTKKPRNRKFDSRYNRPRMLPKEGIKSDPLVFESATERNRALAPTLSPPAREWHCAVFGSLPQSMPDSTWIAPTYLNTRPLTSFVRTQRPDVDMDAFGMVAKGSGVGELSGTHSLFLDSSV